MPYQPYPRSGWKRQAGTALLCLLLPAWFVPGLAGTEEPSEPPFFAVTNARIVTAAGPVIEKGTVVIAKGLISAVGPEAVVPPEAWVIDGEGLTVYPGLVDALSSVGLKTESPPAGAGRPGRSAPSENSRPDSQPAGPQDRPAASPWKNAAEEFQPSDPRIETWRNGGFTSAVVVPEEGIFPGQAAVMNLGGEKSGQMTVSGPAALLIRFQRAGRSFPGSLMGMIAYVRQMFLDAEQYQTAWSVYMKNPLGIARPAYDRALEPLVDTRTNGRPILLPGNLDREIRRAVDLGREIGMRTIVYGGQQGYASPDWIRKSGAPVLISTKWPEESKDADPDAEVALQTLRFRDRAPSSPAALEQAGVAFAFYSDGVKSPTEMLAGVRRAVEAGLTEEAAVKALTLNPARIFGVDDRLGSLEVGKIANLVVTDENIFRKDAKIRMVFVDGRKYAVRESDRPAEPRPRMQSAQENSDE